MNRSLLTLLLALLPYRLAAEPFKPKDDAFVVDRLPASLIGLRKARSQPKDAADAALLAREYLRIAQRTSDPAFVRYAEQVLAPWPAENNAELRFLTAVIQQHKHEFEAALSEIEAVLRLAPGHEGASLLKASILATLGKYTEAKKVFASDLRLISSLHGLTIFLNLSSLTGALGKSEEVLQRSVTERAAAAEQSFAWSVLAEMAVRRGDFATGEQRFQKALQLEPDNSYTLAAYCDLLLSAQRPREVLDLIESTVSSEALLTRRYIAERKAPEGFVAQLKATGHLRELALLQLETNHSPDLALDSALKNWEKQKEPIDAILVLKTALKSAQLAEAGPVIDWINAAQLEDQRLNQLAKSVHQNSVRK